MLKVYLAGEIHTNWREEIIESCRKENLDIQFSSPVTDHASSDDCGVDILGTEEKNFWKDRKGANINSIRTKKSIKDSDVVVVKFGGVVVVKFAEAVTDDCVGGVCVVCCRGGVVVVGNRACMGLQWR